MSDPHLALFLLVIGITLLVFSDPVARANGEVFPWNRFDALYDRVVVTTWVLCLIVGLWLVLNGLARLAGALPR